MTRSSARSLSPLAIFAPLLFAACGEPPTFETDVRAIGAPVCPGPDTLEGIDVSSWQGDIDWMQVAGSGRVFAIARAGHGLDPDLDFDFNWAGIKSAGLIRGVYHYFQPELDATQQADILADAVGSLGPGDLPPVIDVESTGGLSGTAIKAAIRTWVDRIEARLGRSPMIYTGGYFWDDNVGGDDYADLPLWLPSYSTNCPRPPIPWSTWRIHQYSSTGRVPGIQGNVDLDKFDGTMDELIELAGGAACTRHCEGDVIIGADCGSTDCSTSGGTCSDDALGVRCVSTRCPATGTTDLCTSATTLLHCVDGAATEESCPKGHYCQTEADQDHCVAAQPVWGSGPEPTGSEVVGAIKSAGGPQNVDTPKSSGGCTCARPDARTPLGGALVMVGLAALALRRRR